MPQFSTKEVQNKFRCSSGSNLGPAQGTIAQIHVQAHEPCRRTQVGLGMRTMGAWAGPASCMHKRAHMWAGTFTDACRWAHMWMRMCRPGRVAFFSQAIIFSPSSCHDSQWTKGARWCIGGHLVLSRGPRHHLMQSGRILMQPIHVYYAIQRPRAIATRIKWPRIIPTLTRPVQHGLRHNGQRLDNQKLF